MQEVLDIIFTTGCLKGLMNDDFLQLKLSDGSQTVDEYHAKHSAASALCNLPRQSGKKRGLCAVYGSTDKQDRKHLKVGG